MHCCGFQQVAADFVVVGDGTQEVGCDVALVVEGFETAPDADVFVFFGEGFCGFGVRVAVDPLFDFY